MLHSTELHTCVWALAVFTQHSFVDKRETLKNNILYIQVYFEGVKKSNSKPILKQEFSLPEGKQSFLKTCLWQQI